MSLNNLGVFGDTFNVLTSLFTGLAFAGVIISVILQTQELRDARDEFAKQTDTLSLQQKEMVVQSFDNKFFQMLNLFNKLIQSLEHKTDSYPSKTLLKREIFKYIKKHHFDKCIGHDIESFQRYFSNINNRYDTTFKYYFINLYQIIKYIDKNSEVDETPKEYTNIIRAQLSKDELILLFYNAIGVTEFSGSKYKYLVEEYSFFEHLRYKDLKITDDNKMVDLLIPTYKRKAFGKNIELLKKWDELTSKDNKTQEEEQV